MTPADLTIHVNGVELAKPITREAVVRAVRATAQAERVEGGEISVTFVGPEKIAALNEKYLGRRGPTDVIAFNLEDATKPLGDVYVCPEIARESSEEFGVELVEELLRLVVHGVLHLFGYDHRDEDDGDDSEIFQRQEAILSKLL